ncbi:MAG: ThiF family adenylyltransferase [Alphaproteobacteria bacterium]
MTNPHPLNDDQLERYARHVILKEVGEEGQAKLLKSKVLMIGAGGLGSPVLLYLAAAGIGTIGIVDHDVVDLSNLQRQIIHHSETIGAAKVQSAAEQIALINPEIKIEAHRLRLNADNIDGLVANYDLIIDGSDNFQTRYAVNDAAIRAQKTLVSAAVVRFEGQLSTYRPQFGGPCYRCVFPNPPPNNLLSRCDTVGIFGAIAGVMGSLQATEVIKELLGLGNSMQGRLLLYDALAQEFNEIQITKSSACQACQVDL